MNNVTSNTTANELITRVQQHLIENLGAWDGESRESLVAYQEQEAQVSVIVLDFTDTLRKALERGATDKQLVSVAKRWQANRK